ncbi:hypothetical protein SAFG77S_03627 [Streptomyces afghaniensis]
MVILRSVGPVISTRRSFRASGAGATFQESSARIAAVSGRKSRVEVRAISARRSARRARSSSRRGVNRRCSSATKASAASERTSSCRGRGSASTMASGDGAGADMNCHFLQRATKTNRRFGTGCQSSRIRRSAPARASGASEQWILVSSWWKFNHLLMSRFSGSRQGGSPCRAVHSRWARSASVSMSKGRATSPHSTSVMRGSCSFR